MTDSLQSELLSVFPQKQVLENAPMSRYTTLRLGGPAQVLVEIASLEQLSAALRIARQRQTPVTVLGNGSNLLVLDGGIDGLVVHIGSLFAHISDPVSLPDGRVAITAQAGASLQKLAGAALAHGLTGLEFAAGIPGTVGGAAYMNAGAYGGEMKDVVSGVTLMNEKGEAMTFTNEEMAFGYRSSRLSQLPPPCAATSVTVCLTPGDPDAIRATMRDFAMRRREKQPLSQPSCGSTFKRPQGHFAGTLIDQCGLKGARIGGASVSTLHAGFLVNDRNGTAADYLALIAHVQNEVLRQTGVRLEPEVRVIGKESPATAL